MHKPFLLGTVLLALLSVSKPVPTPVQVMVNYENVGPYEAFQENSIFSFTYSVSKTAYILTEILEIRNPKTNALYSSTKNATHSLNARTRYNVSFNLKTKNYFGNDGMNITVIIMSGENSVYENSFTLFPMEKRKVYVNKDNVERLKSEVVSLKGSINKVSLIYDDFNFYNIERNPQTYLFYGLNLSLFTFLHNSKVFDYESAILSFDDPNNVFEFLEHKDGKIYLEMDINDYEESKTFKFHNQLYVNRSNLKVSNQKLPGFVESDDLFFPVNSKKYVKDCNFELTVYGCGYNKYDLVFSIDFDDTKSLIGNCYQNDYCVVGEIS